MEYYLLLPADKIIDINESNKLGETNIWGVFWGGPAFEILSHFIDNKPDILDDIRIIDLNKKKYSLTEFFDIIKHYEIRVN